MKRSPASRLTRAWHAWATAYLLLAVAWPAAGPLPWVAWGVHPASDHAAYASEPASHHHDDADIPGSPTHPADHDCAQCQVLKHLSRCLLSAPWVATVQPIAGDPDEIPARVQPLYASRAVTPPPIRGPPLHQA
jgi:hypothetical protein